MAQEVLGAHERDTLVALSNLAQTLAAQGKHDEAEPIMREDLKASISLLGANHADTLVAYSNLAQLLALHGKHKDACELFRAELEGSRTTHGRDHPLTLACSSRLVESLLANGEMEAAEPLLRENLATTRKVLGHAHPDGGVMVRNLAKLLQAQGKLEDAESLAREELTMCLPYGTEHARTREATALLASLLRDQGKRSAALPLLRELHGDHHPRTMQAISAAVGQVRHSAAELGVRRNGTHAPLLASAPPLTVCQSSRRAYRVTQLQIEGRDVEAEPLAREAVETSSSVLGVAHPFALIARSQLAAVLRAIGGMENEAEADRLFS